MKRPGFSFLHKDQERFPSAMRPKRPGPFVAGPATATKHSGTAPINAFMETINPSLAQFNPLKVRIDAFIAHINPLIAPINPFIAQIDPLIAGIKSFIAQFNPLIAAINPFIAQFNPSIAAINAFIARTNPLKVQLDPLIATINSLKSEIRPAVALGRPAASPGDVIINPALACHAIGQAMQCRKPVMAISLGPLQPATTTTALPIPDAPARAIH